MQALVTGQDCSEFFKAFFLETGTQFGVLGHRQQTIPTEHRLNIEAAAATHDGERVTRPDVLVRCKEITLELEEVVLFTGIHNVKQMRGHGDTVAGILRDVLSCTDIHTTVHLTAVGTDDLGTVNRECHIYRQRGLATGCRTHDRQHIISFLTLLHNQKRRHNAP